jgi:Family of unknown function (DUF6159)
VFRNSWILAKASWKVLTEDKKLTMFPLFSGIASVIAAALFFVPVGLIASSSSGFTPVAWVLTFLAYVVLAFIVIFFNSALVFAADKRLRGEEVTVGEALQSSMERIHVLLPWAVVSATVSIVLRAVEQRAGIVGRIIVGLLGVAWTLVTFLVLPVLVFEKTGPIEAVKRSGHLFKKTWGENVVTNGGIGLVGLVAIIAGAPLLLLIAAGPVGAVVGIGLFVLWVIAVSLVTSTLTGIFQTALYRYATDAEVIGFDKQQLDAAFRPRKGSSWLR